MFKDKGEYIMTMIFIIIILAAIVVSGIIWSKRNIEHDAIQKAHEDEEIDKLRKLM
jgi:heme/copper-type cytochrome/quinol oxidase subunit 4